MTVAVPASTKVDEYTPTVTTDPVTPERFRRAFAAAGGPALLSSDSPLVIVNDGYRHTPTALLLGWLDDLDRTFLDRAEFLIATGTHAAPTAEHLTAIFGHHLNRIAARIHVHDSARAETMVRVGGDRFGESAFLNRRIFAHPQRLVIGSVEPHYFAGFTGGRKSVFPGLCDRATTERNHNLANSQEARPLRLDGNPVADQLMELMALIPDESFFTIQVVVDAQGRLADLHCGQLHEAFLQAVKTAHAVFACRADRPYDTVLSELFPPLDQNLYQAQKALENTQAAVKDGGAVVVLSACPEGVGSPHFFAQAKTWDRDRNLPGDGVLRFGSHKLSRVNAMTRRIDVRLYSDAAPDQVRQVFFEPIDDLQEYLDERCRTIPGHRLAIIRDAGHTVVTTNTIEP